MFFSLWQKNWFRKIFILFFSTITVFSSAASCTLPGLNTGGSAQTLGILKRDPSVKRDGFGAINAVTTKPIENSSQKCINNLTSEERKNVNFNGLASLSGVKLEQKEINGQQILYYLSREKGLFKSYNNGCWWQRVYLFPIDINPQTVDKDGKNVRKNDKQLQREIEQKIAKNDQFAATDFVIDRNNANNIYIAGHLNGIGKVYFSNNGGQSFQEIYTETDKYAVKFIVQDPNNPLRIYLVLEGGALLRSLDGGSNWQKIRAFRETPIQIGFIPEFGNLFYILFARQGLITSRDDGETWQVHSLSKIPSQIGEKQENSGFNLNPLDSSPFGLFEKMVPVVLTDRAGTQPWLMIADNQLWYIENLDLSSRVNLENANNNTSNSLPQNAFKKLVLPLQNEKFNMLDVTYDPQSGLDKILVSIDDKLFETKNQGQSWSLKDKIQLSTPIGYIGQILIDKKDPDIIYLMLVSSKVSRRNGTFADL